MSAGSKSVENGAWGYLEPFPHLAPLAHLVAFYWHAMDEWWEEDERVFVHARDPRKSITVVECFRSVEVVLDGTVVASTRRARRLDETDLPARYYIPREDVRTDLLAPSEHPHPLSVQGRGRLLERPHAGTHGRGRRVELSAALSPSARASRP